MIDKYKIFLERKSISQGILIGYKTPFDKNNPVMVIENNNTHFFFEESRLLNEFNSEYKTPQGVWRVKSKKDSGEYMDLDNMEGDLKVGKKYQFMGISFSPQYTRVEGKNIYFTTIQPIDNLKGGKDEFPSWVLYSDSLEELERDVRVNSKLYIEEYNL